MEITSYSSFETKYTCKDFWKAQIKFDFTVVFIYCRIIEA